MEIKYKKEDIDMNKKRLCKHRYRLLHHGKGKKVGIFESISLNFAGWADGRKGLPRKDNDEGCWLSPFMNRNINAYKEFCSHIWGSLQVQNESNYIELAKLINEIQQKKDSLTRIQNEFKSANSESASRKKGEDSLTDAQVSARRTREKARRLAPLNSKNASIEQELEEDREALVALYNQLVEDINTTRLICHRVKNHILLRMDIYWNSALTYHPDNMSMPVVPGLDLQSEEAELQYLNYHAEIMKFAERFYDITKDDSEAETEEV